MSVLSTARFMKRIVLYGTNSGSDLSPETFEKYGKVSDQKTVRETRRYESLSI